MEYLYYIVCILKQNLNDNYAFSVLNRHIRQLLDNVVLLENKFENPNI